MPTPIDPATGLPSGDMTYGAGYGWLPFYNQRDQLLSQLYGMQGGLGSKLLDQLGNWAMAPGAGPLGLSAFARYGGGAQNVAAGTNGAGIANPNAGIFDRLLQGISQSVMNPGSPFNPANNGQYNTDAAKIDPNKAPALTPESAAKAPNAAEDFFKEWSAGKYTPEQQAQFKAWATPPSPQVPATPGPFAQTGFNAGGFPVLADDMSGTAFGEGGDIGLSAKNGTGMTIGGQQHFIVDEQGNKVAALTEDGKPEHVGGVGGVEVTPLDPQRHADYLKSKQYGNMIGGLLGGMITPKETFATGGASLFDNIPGSQVAPDEVPTIGGPSTPRADQVGSYFKPTDTQPLPTEATAPDMATRLRGYAKLFGSALSAGNTAVPTDFLQQLNAGQAPRRLLSSQALGTLLPSQRENYTALLSQMGLGDPKDILDQINAARPDKMI